eukprot:5083274-Amphidinium_carterae.1
MVEWVKGFEGSTEDLSLSNAESASNSWVYAFNKLSSHGSALARLYAVNLVVDVATPEYLAASDHWAASWRTLAERAEHTAMAWEAAFAVGKTKALSDAGRGAILGATDNWAYVLQLVSNRALASSQQWT